MNKYLISCTIAIISGISLAIPITDSDWAHILKVQEQTLMSVCKSGESSEPDQHTDMPTDLQTDIENDCCLCVTKKLLSDKTYIAQLRDAVQNATSTTHLKTVMAQSLAKLNIDNLEPIVDSCGDEVEAKYTDKNFLKQYLKSTKP